MSSRVFPVLVVTAKTSPLSFMVVQIPVNIKSLPEAFYSSGRNLKEGDTEIKRKRHVLGYVGDLLNVCLSYVLQTEFSVAAISALSVVGSSTTRALNGLWLQQVMQKSRYLFGHKRWGFLELSRGMSAF